MIGEPDAGKPHVRFDEGAQETCDTATRLCPTLRSPRENFSGLEFCYALPDMPDPKKQEPAVVVGKAYDLGAGPLGETNS